MKKLFCILAILVLAVGFTAPALQAQSGGSYNSLGASIFPNYPQPISTFTAASTNGPTLSIPATSYGTILISGTHSAFALSIQGSIDGGTTWTTLNTAAITAAGTLATTITANGLYIVNVAGLSNVRFITTSATFTGTSVIARLVVTGNRGSL